MFIRETVTTKAGVRYIQHRLVETFRVGAKVKQKMLLSLGTLSLPREQWGELVDAIEDCLNDTIPLFPSTPEIFVLAQEYAEKLVEKRLAEQEALKKLAPASPPPVNSGEQEAIPVFLDSIKTRQNRTVAGEEVLLQEMEQYDFDEALSFLTEKECHYAKILIIGRALYPASERETVRWTREVSALPEMLGMKSSVHDTGLHRVAVKLWKHKEALERFLAREAKKKFNLQEHILLYDLTNTYFEGQLAGVKLAKHGKSKERRSDCPLISLALAVDEDGFVKQSKFYEGNVSEPETLKDVLQRLSQDNLPFEQKTIVIDAGIASEENLKLIRTAGFHYVAVSRQKSFDDDFWQQSEEKKVVLQKKDAWLRVWLTKTEHEAFLRVESEGKAAKGLSILKRKMGRFEEGLSELQEKIGKKRTQKSVAKIYEQLGRLKEKYGVGQLYTVEITEEKGTVTAFSWSRNERAAVVEEEKKRYVIRSSRLDLDEEELSKVHRSLTQVESSFRSMKSNLGLRPNFHKNEDSIQAHVFITVLAYHFLASLQKKLHDEGYRHDWKTIRDKLATQERSTVIFRTASGQQVHNRVVGEATAEQHELFSLLGCQSIRLLNKTLVSGSERPPP